VISKPASKTPSIASPKIPTSILTCSSLSKIRRNPPITEALLFGWPRCPLISPKATVVEPEGGKREKHEKADDRQRETDKSVKHPIGEREPENADANPRGHPKGRVDAAEEPPLVRLHPGF
jgi:hypothetical protein